MGPNKDFFRGKLGPHPLTLSDRSGARGPGSNSPWGSGEGGGNYPLHSTPNAIQEIFSRFQRTGAKNIWEDSR